MNVKEQMPSLRNRDITVYTHVDHDGIACGAIIRKFCPNAYVIQINYGKDPQFDRIRPGAVVIVTDFSFPIEDMEKLKRDHDLIWIDHHPVINEYDEQGFKCNGLRRTDCSAAQLTWEYFFPDNKLPDAVKYISDYDTWQHNYPQSIPMFYALGLLEIRPIPSTDALWDKILTNGKFVESLIENGVAVQKYVKLYNATICKDMGFEINFHGHRTIACNLKTANSLLFDSVSDKKYDIKLLFSWFANIGRYRVSIFSDTGVNVGELAKKYNGGGHPGAAGFTVAELPFDLPTLTEAHAPFANVYGEIDAMYQELPIIRRYESSSLGPVIWSHAYGATFGKYKALCVNHPTCPADAFFATGQNFHYDIGVRYALTNTGWWRYRVVPLNPNINKEDLLQEMKQCGGDWSIVNHEVWGYLPVKQMGENVTRAIR